MKKRLAYTFILLACTFLSLEAGEKAKGEYEHTRFTFGAEWSYVASFWSGWHYNFFSSEGYRIDQRGNAAGYTSSAEAYLHAGYNFNRHWNLSFYAGYAGIGHYNRVVPMSFRITRYFGKNPLADRWLTFLDIGSGICIKPGPQEIVTAKAGGGWRMSLSRCTKLDFLASARVTYTHPTVTYDSIAVPVDMTNRNEALVLALSVGISLTF